jgi:hypothetical protein
MWLDHASNKMEIEGRYGTSPPHDLKGLVLTHLRCDGAQLAMALEAEQLSVLWPKLWQNGAFDRLQIRIVAMFNSLEIIGAIHELPPGDIEITSSWIEFKPHPDSAASKVRIVYSNVKIYFAAYRSKDFEMGMLDWWEPLRF